MMKKVIAPLDGSTNMSSPEPIEELPKKSVRGVMMSRLSKIRPPTESILASTNERTSSPVIKDSDGNTHTTPEVDSKAAEEYFMSLNRAERRKIEKRSHVKIPSSNVPFINLNKKHG